MSRGLAESMEKIHMYCLSGNAIEYSSRKANTENQEIFLKDLKRTTFQKQN